MGKTKSPTFRNITLLLLGCLTVVLLTISIFSLSPKSQSHRIRTGTLSPAYTPHSLQSTNIFDNSSIAFVVRAHAGYIYELVSFLWMLRAQQMTEESIAVLVVPTELEAIPVLKQALHDHWRSNSQVVVELLQLPERFFESHCCHLDTLCTEQWRQEKISGGWPHSSLDRYCSINTPLHYHITDAALRQTLLRCSKCQSVVITNADNFYAPNYVSECLKLLMSADIVLVNMVHRGAAVATKVESGSMDLGAIMISTALLRTTALNFATSLPYPAEPQHWHDADYWFVQRLIEKGARLKHSELYLFTHN